MDLADEGHQRSLKDFLTLYNKLAEQCFERCVYNLNDTRITRAENSCINVCADRYVTYNQKLMMKFMEHQTLRQQAQVREAQAAAEKAADNTSATDNTSAVAPT